jgi:hypothetical protein
MNMSSLLWFVVLFAAALQEVDSADYGRFQYGTISWRSLSNDPSTPTRVQIIVER